MIQRGILSPLALRRLGRILGVLCVAFIAFATLSPIDLRPQIGGQSFEHLLAFFALATLLGVGYPRHLLAVLLAVGLFAFAVEFLQVLVPGRHGRLADAGMKIVGSLLGLVAAALVDRLVRALSAEPDEALARKR